jgi:hypothetical protein
MTTEIIVLKPPEEEQFKTNKSERQILYEHFEKNAHLPAFHFQIFMEMEETEERDKDIKTNIPSILIKNTLQYCTPIIRELPDFTVRKKVVDIFKKNKKEEKKQMEYYNITTQLDTNILCNIEGELKKKIQTFTSPKNETLKIIGLVIPSVLLKNQNNSFINYFNSISNKDLIISGKYGLTEFQSENYTQIRISEINSRTSYENQHKIYFKSDTDALNKIIMINKYIKYTNNYYKINYPMLIKYAYDMPFYKQIKQEIYLNTRRNQETKLPALVHSHIEKYLSTLSKNKLSNNKNSNEHMFIHYQLYDKLHQINMLGTNHPNSKKILHEFEQFNDSRKNIIAYNKLKFQKNLEYAKKKSISIDKFNITDLSVLSPMQKKIVEIEFKKMETYRDTVTKYKEDFQIVDSLIWAMDNDRKTLIKKKLDEIGKIIKLPKNLEDMDDQLKNNKKINIICPHNIAKAKKIIEPSKNQIKKSGEIREFLINKFSLPVVKDGYFCRICGELLADADEEEILKYISGKRISFVQEIDPLKSQIWKEVAQIMTSYVKFKDAVNYKNLVSNITNILRPEIGSIEFNLYKIKSNTRDSVSCLISIYIAVYTIALVVNMIIKNYGKITFTIRQPMLSKPQNVNLKGGNAPKQQVRVQNIINNALFLILRIKNVAINESVSISNDSIKPILIKAYKWATQLQSEKIVETKDTSMSSNFLKTDNVYNYALDISKLSDIYTHVKTTDSKPKKDIYSIKKILGRTWETIESEWKSNISIYATMISPPEWTGTNSIYIYGSYQYLTNYIKNKLYTENVVPYSPKLTLYNDEYDFLKIEEEKIHNAYKKTVIRPFNKIFLYENFMLKFNDFRIQNIYVDKYYDNKGIKHKFNIYVYQKANSKGMFSGTKKEYNSSDVLSWLKTDNKKKTDDFKNWFLVDSRCSICKVLMSQTKNLTVEKSLEQIEKLTTFYAYYDSKCPKGELHDFLTGGKENKCMKCGITSKITKDNDKKYYEKYLSCFKKDRKETMKLEVDLMKNLSITKKYKANTEKFAEWKINHAPALELTKLFKLQYNVWINLGLSINKDYKLIESGKLNPSLSSSDDVLILRNIQLYGYYLTAIKSYYLIKHYAMLSSIPYDLKQILSKNKVSELPKKLKDIDKTISIKYNYYKNNSKPYNVSNFLLYSLSKTLLDMYKTMKDSEMTISSELINYIIKKIIKTDKLMSKPDLTKIKTTYFSDIEISDKTSEVVDIDANIQDGYVDDQPEKELADMSDEEPDDEFSMNDMDMEIDGDDDENTLGNPMDY